MWVARAEDGFLFGGLTGNYVDTLRAVPMLLESSDPRVRERLLPDTYDDPEEERQWRQHATPELERLFMSRCQLVRRDLAAMQQEPEAESFLLRIADGHVSAWLSSLNAARLALFALNDLTAEHMERDGSARVGSKQQEALLRIHFLAEVQGALLDDLDLVEPRDDATPPGA